MSMTGFGRVSKDGPSGRFIVEIQSLNRKNYELQIYLPKEFSRFEIDIRKQVASSLLRGSVTLRVQWIPSQTALAETLPDPLVVNTLRKEWEKIAIQSGFPKETVTLAFLMPYISGAFVEGSMEEKAFLQMCIEEALHDLMQMRQKEGALLQKDLSGRLHSMKQILQSIREALPNENRRFQETLQEKITSAVLLADEMKDKLVRELILVAEKMDVSEEITRLNAHFAQMEECIFPAQRAVGRKMDFLVQEMGREINTMGSKSMDSTISRAVIEMKNELERMREQIQNIE